MSTGGGPEGTNRDLVTSKIHVFWNRLGTKKSACHVQKTSKSQNLGTFEVGNTCKEFRIQRSKSIIAMCTSDVKLGPHSRNWGVAHCHQQSKNDYFPFIQDGGASICLLFSSLPGEMIRFVCGSTTKQIISNKYRNTQSLSPDRKKHQNKLPATRFGGTRCMVVSWERSWQRVKACIHRTVEGIPMQTCKPIHS